MIAQSYVPGSAQPREATVLLPTGAPGSRARGRAIRLAAFLLLVLFVGGVPAGVPDSVDAGTRLLQARALVSRASLSIPSEIRGEFMHGMYRGPDGLWYSKYGIGLPLLWTVPVAMANTASSLTAMPASILAGFAVSFVNPLVIVGTIASLIVILRRLAASRPSQIVTVAVFGLGATTLPFANSCWSEPLVGLLVLWSVAVPLLLPDSCRTAAISGLLVSAATLVKPEMVLLAGPLLLVFRENLRRCAAFFASACLGPLITLLLNALTTGSIFVSGYGDEAHQFGDPRPGLWAFTTGLDHSIFLFFPGLVLGMFFWWCVPVVGLLRRARGCVLITATIYFVFYAAWWCWGGHRFGPRFLYPLAAVAALPVGPGLYAWTGRFHHRFWPAVVWSALALILLCELPLQLSGMCVKPHQAIDVSTVTHDPQWLSQMKLLSLKLRRGLHAPEQYRKSDFVSLAAGEVDVDIDHRQFRTYQYLNHWWSFVLANRVRFSTVAVGHP